MGTKNVAEEYNMNIKNVAEDTQKRSRGYLENAVTNLDVGNPMVNVSADDSVHNTILIGASMGVHYAWVWLRGWPTCLGDWGTGRR